MRTGRSKKSPTRQPVVRINAPYNGLTIFSLPETTFNNQPPQHQHPATQPLNRSTM